MTEAVVFYVVSAGLWLLQLAVPAGFFYVSRWTRSLMTRSVLTIIAAWIVTVIYVITVYNPVGLAFGVATGMESPQTKFDNNIVASMLLGGWIYPTLSLIVTLIIRVAIHKSAIGSK